MVDKNPYAPPMNNSGPPESAVDVRSISRRWVVGVTLCGFVVGVASRIARDSVQGPVHYDALVALIVLAVMCVVVLIRFWRFPLAQGKRALQIALFCVWASFAMGWSVAHGGIWEDILGISAVGWIGSAIAGALALRIPHSQHADMVSDRA